VSHWLKTPHWSSDIPLDSSHPRLDALDDSGYVRLRDLQQLHPEPEYLGLEYMDWKSGGDTNFAPIATADGELDCQGFWKPGDERPDKGGKYVNAERCLRSSRRAGRGELRAGAGDQARAPDYDTARPDACGTTLLNRPIRGGSCGRGSSSDYPDSFMMLMEQTRTGCRTPTPSPHPAHRHPARPSASDVVTP
jgi:hypothetical protein